MPLWILSPRLIVRADVVPSVVPVDANGDAPEASERKGADQLIGETPVSALTLLWGTPA